MTCIIGFIDKSKKKMIIAGDRLGSNGHSGNPVSQPKIFKHKKILFGYTSSFRFGQIIEMYFSVKKDTRTNAYEYMVLDVLPHIREILEEHKYSGIDDKGKSGTIIMMYKGKIFILQSDWSILEYDNFQSVGSGAECAYGALFALQNLKISNKQKVNKSLSAASDLIVSVGGSFDTISLKY